MGDEGYFDWRATVEIHQWESEQQVQALLQETRRLREENDVLHIQVSSSSPPCSRQPRSQWVNSRQNEEATYPGNAEFPSNESERMLEQRSPLAYHTQQDESSDSTRVSTKRKRDKKSQLSDTMRARLGPQIPNMRGGGGGGTTWNNSPRGISWPLSCTCHYGLAPPSASTTTSREFCQ